MLPGGHAGRGRPCWGSKAGAQAGQSCVPQGGAGRAGWARGRGYKAGKPRAFALATPIRDAPPSLRPGRAAPPPSSSSG